jgi:hypothetical protein
MPLFAMPLPDGCVGCMMRGPLHKVDDLCVVPFTRSLSAEGSALFVRILIAITPRMYGEVLALTIHRRRPDFEVLLAPPGSLEGEIERFGPHVLMQDAKDPVALLGLPDGILCRVRMLTTERVDATVEMDGTVSEVHDVLFEDLFGVLEKAEGLSKGDGARVKDRRPEDHKGKATSRKDGGA